MPYKKKDRPSWYTDLRTEDGWKTGVALPALVNSPKGAGRNLALKIEAMWHTLAVDYRAWDVLGLVLSGARSIGWLYDLYVRVGGDVPELRRRLNDTDLSTFRDGFLVVYDKQVKSPESRARMRRHLDALFAEPLLASAATVDTLTTRLYEYPAEANTLRTVHASWSVFFEHALVVKHAIAVNPMLAVARPPRVKRPPEFYELDTIEHIVDWQPTEKRRALMALAYGTGLEISVMLGLAKSDINADTKEIRAPGTKAHTRDRVVRVDDWAWSRLWPYASELKDSDTLFGDTNRWTASDWHRATIGDGEKASANQYGIYGEHVGLKLRKRIKMYAARHAWAARHLRAGVPVEVVQKQLGHGTAKETLDTYGMFLPGVADRAHWQQQVTESEKRRRNASEQPTARRFTRHRATARPAVPRQGDVTSVRRRGSPR